MMRERVRRAVGNFVAFVFALFFSWPASSWAWNHDKAWLQQQLRGSADLPGEIDHGSYLGRTRDRAHGIESSSLTSHGGLGDREYWQGDPSSLLPTSIAGNLLNYFDDMVTNFSDGFSSCLDPSVRFHWSWFHSYWELRLWWPVYQVHTHPVFQNRYGDLFALISDIAAIFGISLAPTTSGPPPLPYSALYLADAHAWLPYIAPTVPGYPPIVVPPLVPYAPFRYLIQPMQMGHAKFNMQHDLFTKYGPLAAALTAAGMDTSWIFPDPTKYPALANPIPGGAPSATQRNLRYHPFNPYNAEFFNTTTSSALGDLDLDHFDPLPDLSPHQRELRYATTPVSGRHPLEFSVLPSLWVLAWRFIPVLNAAMMFLPSGCRPPTKFAYPWDSDRMEMFYHTRDPLIGKFTFTTDTGFQNDYNRWLTNPKVCTEYEMRNDPSYPIIPHDQFDAGISLPLLPTIPLPDLISPMTSSPSPYHAMCTPRVGTNVPFTIHNAPQGVEVLAALENIEKASRLSYAYYRQFIQPNASYNAYYTFRMIDEGKDKIQFTYHDGMPNSCRNFGQMGELFGNSNAMVKKGDYGLYNATIWQRSTCHIGFGSIVPAFIALGSLAGLIAILTIFT